MIMTKLMNYKDIIIEYHNGLLNAERSVDLIQFLLDTDLIMDYPELLDVAQGAFEELVQILKDLYPGISDDLLNQKCIKFWALMHGLVGLLDMKIEPETDSNAGEAMSVVKRDYRAFLEESFEL